MRQPVLFEPALPEIETERLVLRHAQSGQEDETVAFFDRNRAHFARWDPPAPELFYSRGYWLKRLPILVEDYRFDRAVRFALQERRGGTRVIGRIGCSQIVRGAFQSCMLGYQLDHEFVGRGLMFEALAATINFMFTEKKIHRIQASYMPDNGRSGRLLDHLGFVREGLAKKYLFIGGTWHDHVITALVNTSDELPLG